MSVIAPPYLGDMPAGFIAEEVQRFEMHLRDDVHHIHIAIGDGKHVVLTLDTTNQDERLWLREPARLVSHKDGARLRLVTAFTTHLLSINPADHDALASMLERAPQTWRPPSVFEPVLGEHSYHIPKPLRAVLGTNPLARWGSDAGINVLTTLRARGAHIFATCHEPGVRVWERDTGTHHRTIAREQRIQTIEVDQKGEIVLFLGEDGSVSRWTEAHTTHHNVRAHAIALDPMGSWYAWAEGDTITVQTGTSARELSCPETQWLSTDAQGQRLLAATSLGDVHIWEVNGARAWHHKDEAFLLGAKLSPTGTYFALQDHSALRVHEVEGGTHTYDIKTDPRETVLGFGWCSQPGHLLRVTSQKRWEVVDVVHKHLIQQGNMERVSGTLDIDTTHLWVGTRIVNAWSLEDACPRDFGSRHTATLRQVGFLRDGAITTAPRSGQLRCWHEGKEAWTWASGNLTVVSPDGQAIATAHEDRVEIWTRETRTLRTALSFQRGYVRDMTFSECGERLAFTTLRGTAHVWDITTHQRWDMEPGPWHSIAMGPRAQRVVLGGTHGRMAIVDLVSGTHTERACEGELYPLEVAWSLEGDLIATAGHTFSLWSPEGERRCEHVYYGDRICAVTLAPDGAMVATGDSEGNLALWRPDTVTGPFLMCEVHDMAVTTLAISPEGRSLVTGSSDMTVRLWEMRELLTRV